jgi:hypothetical protein
MFTADSVRMILHYLTEEERCLLGEQQARLARIAALGSTNLVRQDLYDYDDGVLLRPMPVPIADFPPEGCQERGVPALKMPLLPLSPVEVELLEFAVYAYSVGKTSDKEE